MRVSMCCRTVFEKSCGHAQGPIYIKGQRQHCDDASDTALVENNGIAPQ